MMELADVPDSKSGGSDTVRVRPPLPAPTQKGDAKHLPFALVSPAVSVESATSPQVM